MFQPLESRRFFSTTFMVTSTADAGPGSLRQAILDANNSPGLDEIHFNIGSGVATISPKTQLTRLDDEVIIDGTSQPGYQGKPIIEINGANTTNADGILIFHGSGSTLKGLVINRFDGWGVRDVSTGFNTIQNCYVGTNVAGNADLGNGTGGISLFSKSNLVGGPNIADRNVVSGNGGGTSNFIGPGIQTTEGGGGNVIENNFVGTAADGVTPLGNNAVGVYVTDHGTTIRGNVVAHNGSAGVCFGPSGKDNLVTANSIFNNFGIGIDLRSASSALPDGPTPNDTLDVDTGGNRLQNAPAIGSAQALVGKTTVKGSLSSEKNKVYRVELYMNPAGDTQGEGKKFLQAFDVQTDNNGKASFSVDLSGVKSGVITATATDPDNNTSEFGNRKGITVGPIAGTVYDDRDADGVHDAAEPGLADWRVWLDADKDGVLGKSEKSLLTDASGKYKFDSLVSGDYQVRCDALKGWRQTAPGTLFHNRALPTNDVSKPADFGFTNSVLIKGNVFADSNSNGTRDAGENALSGVRVWLDTDNDRLWDSNERLRITTSAGAYRFAGIKKGTYVVRVEHSSETTVSQPESGFYSVKLNPSQAVTRNFGLFYEQEIPE